MKFGATFASKALKTDPKTVISSIKKHQIPLSTAKDLDPLIHQIGDAKFVLLGEATHGTSEFY
jgi:erythromycin esterase